VAALERPRYNLDVRARCWPTAALLLQTVMNMTGEPSAFMSYVRSDDDHDDGRITKLRERLAGEVRMQTGKSFPIFQDRNDILWGQQWRSVIDDALSVVRFLIPIVTPSFFESEACRVEFNTFLARESLLGVGTENGAP
jgi:cobaltochelatase CobT